MAETHMFILGNSNPLLYTIKKRSTVDSDKHYYSESFLQKIKNKKVKFEDLQEEIFSCAELKHFKVKHLHEFPIKIQSFIMNQNLPFAMTKFPKRYLYLYPNFEEEQERFKACA